MTGLQVKTLHTTSEFEEISQLERAIWRLNDNRDTTPAHILRTVSECGGLVLGAFAHGRMIGFSYVLPGLTSGHEIYHHSHILGVHPDWQNRGIGFAIKKAHYDIALSRGIYKITWTFDPLLGKNAHLNITKLGGIVRTYRQDVYGELMGGSELVGGIPSDRFYLEWFITSSRVSAKMTGSNQRNKDINLQHQTGNPVNSVTVTGTGMQRLLSFMVDKQRDSVLIEIPADFQRIYDWDKDLCREWRLKSREMFTAYFNCGFRVVDFYRITTDSGVRNFYYLDKKDTLLTKK